MCGMDSLAALQPKIDTAIKLFEAAAFLRMNGVTEASERAQAIAERFARSAIDDFDRLRTGEIISPATSPPPR